MDLNVELPNGIRKTVPVHVKCTLSEAVDIIGRRTGLCKEEKEMEEFSLAWKDDNAETFINVTWLNPAIPLMSQGVGSARTVLLRKKYFLKNEDLDEYSKTNSLLLENIYAQLRQSFVAGLYQCTAFQAAQIGGMAALVEYPGYMVKNPKSLRSIGLIKKIIPEKFWHVRGIENQIAKGIETSTLSEKDAMVAFISRLRKLETFGFAFFTITLNSEEQHEGVKGMGLLGIGPQLVLTLDIETLESLGQWYFEDLVTFSAEGDVVHMQFAEEMVSVVAEDSESVIAFLGGSKTQLSNQETENVIQRSQSRQPSRGKIKTPVSQQKVGETVEALKQASARLEGPGKEKGEISSPTVSPRPVVKRLEEQGTSPGKPPRRAEDAGKVGGHPALPPAVAKDSKPRGSPPPVKPRRRLQRSSEPEVAVTDGQDTDAPPKFPLPEDPVMEVALSQSSQEQQHAAPPEDQPPPVPPHRRASSTVALSEDTPPPTDVHGTDAPPKFPLPEDPVMEAAQSQSSQEQQHEDHPPPVPSHRSASHPVAPFEDTPPPVPPHRRASAPPENQPPLVPSHRSTSNTVSLSESMPPSVPPHRGVAPAVAPREDDQSRVPPQETSPQKEKRPPPKPARGNFITRQSPPTAAPQTVKESLVPPSSTSPQEVSSNGAVSQADASLDVVVEEDEHTKYSHPGSPASLSSQDSSRSEDEKRVENEKKFDTLSKQDAKVLQGRKERLKALKKKKEKGDNRLSCEDISGMQVATEVVKRRATRKAREVAKCISLPPQSQPDRGSLDELNELLELDLSKQRWSQDINPIYDVIAASEAECLLNSSDVTYEDPGKVLSQDKSSFTPPSSATPQTSSNHTPQLKKVVMDVEEVKQAQAAVDSIYGTAMDLFPSDRSTSSASNQSRESDNGDLDTGMYGLVGEREGVGHSGEDIYQVPTTELGDDVEEDIYRFPDQGDSRKRLISDSSTREGSPSPTGRRSVLSQGPDQPTPGIGKRRLVKGGSQLAVHVGKTASSAQVKKAAVEPLKDYTTLKREYRVHFVKVPTGDVVNEMVNLNERVGKVITRLCALIGARQPELYSLYLEGSVLTSVKEPQNLHDNNPRPKGGPTNLDPLLIRGSAFAFLPDQGMDAILLDRAKNFKDHDIYTSRLLALRLTSDDTPPEPLHPQPLRVPADIKFHQCWLNVVQGSQPCSQDDAIRLAAMQYQTYFLDRTQQQSTTAHHKVSEFLPFEYTTARNVEEKVLKEQMTIRSYSRQQAQDSYVHDACTLPTYRVVFFPVKEPRKRFFQNTKLMPMLLGVSKTGVMRVDPKTKEVLDSWDYRIIRNWAYTAKTFLLAFDRQNYPVQTNQGKWINSLIEFHVNSIVHFKEHTPTPGGDFERERSPALQMKKKEVDLTLDIPSQDDVNAIYGEVSDCMIGSADAPLCTPV